MTQASTSVFLDVSALDDALQRLGSTHEMTIAAIRASSSCFVCDVYALQQVVYEHTLAGDSAYGHDLSYALTDALTVVHPVDNDTINLACQFASDYPQLAPRERMHLATAWRHGITTIATGRPERYRGVPWVKTTSLRPFLLTGAG